MARLFTGAPDDPRWARPALWAILVLATALYCWNLSSLTGNAFSNAAVYSGTRSWKAFFFGALDAGGFITVGKPPFALWVMGLSARLFGCGAWQLALPVVAAGVGSVALLYRMVKRDFGAAAGTIAALALTLTPITVAINRDTNPDPVLVLLMLLGAAALLKAVRTGRTMPLVWSGVAIGFAFHTKMMQAYVVLPAFFLVHLWAARGSLGRRVRGLAAGTVTLVVSSAHGTADDTCPLPVDRAVRRCRLWMQPSIQSGFFCASSAAAIHRRRMGQVGTSRTSSRP